MGAVLEVDKEISHLEWGDDFSVDDKWYRMGASVSHNLFYADLLTRRGGSPVGDKTLIQVVKKK
jgi:hypothetical protein